MAHAVRTLSALGALVALDAADGADELLDALGPLIVDGPDRADVARWTVEEDADGWWFRPPGGAAPSVRATPAELLGPVVRRCNHLVARHSPHIAVHAGGIEACGRGVLLAGPTETGKSTLTAGLVLAGARYLSDEAVGIEPDGRLLSYPKPLTLDPGSHDLFPNLAELAVGTSAADAGQWQVPVPAIREDAVAPGAPLIHVMLHRYEPGARTSMTEISRAEALYDLCRLNFRFRRRARQSLDTLAAAVRGARCHRLVSGDLDAAVASVLDTVDASSVPTGG